MILEGIVTSVSINGVKNVAPMGPIVDPLMTKFTLRPFQTSTTYQNLKSNPTGVLHVTDDVLLIAKTAIGRLNELPPIEEMSDGKTFFLTEACRWYRFEVETLDDSQDRTEIQCKIVESARLRDFFGFNRAKHAVLEAAILATRVGILPDKDIKTEIPKLKSAIDKTGGEAEHAAFNLITEYIDGKLGT